MEVGHVSLVAELDTRLVEQQIEAFKKRLENTKLDIPVSSIGEVTKHVKKLNSLSIIPKVDHKPLTELNKHIDKKIAHIKKANEYFKNNPLKVATHYTESASKKRGSTQQNTSISRSNNDIVVLRQINNNLLSLLKTIHNFEGKISEKFNLNSKIGDTQKQESKKQSTKLSQIVSNTKNTFFRNLTRGFQEGIGATYANQGATSFLKGLKYEERLGLIFETFGNQVFELGQRIGNIGFEAIFGMDSAEFIGHIKNGINEISAYIDTEVVEELNTQIDKEIVTLTKNLLSAFTKGKDIPKNLKQIINLFSQVRDEAIKGVQKRKTNKAKEQADIIKQQPIPKYQYDPEKEKTVIVSGGFAGSGGDAAKDIVRLINQMYKGNADIQKIITNFTDVKTGNSENMPIWAMNALARIVDQSVGLGFNPDSIDMVMKVLASKEANPDRPVELVGYSAGGYVVNEAMAILKELGITDVKGVGIGTPTDIGVSHDLQELDYTAFLGDKDGLQIFRKILGAINLLNKKQEAKTVPNVVGHNFEAYGATSEVQSKIGEESDYTEREQLDLVRINPSALLSGLEDSLTSIIGAMQTASLSYQQYLIVALQSMLPTIEQASTELTGLFLNSQDNDVQAESLKSLNFLSEAKDVISNIKGDKISNTTLQKFILAMAKGMGVSSIDQPIPSLIAESGYAEEEGLYSARNNTLHLSESLANKLQEGNYEGMSGKEKNVLIHELRHFFQTFLPKQQILGMNNMIQKGIPVATISQMRLAAETSVAFIEKKQGHSMPPVQREEMIDKEMDAYFFADMYADRLNDFFLQLQEQAENIDFSDFSFSLVPSIENEFYPPLQESIEQVNQSVNNSIVQDPLTSVVSTGQESSKERTKLSTVLRKELKMFLEELKTILSQIKIEAVVLNGVESLPDNIVQDSQETGNTLSEEIEIPIVSNEFAQELEEISALINNPPTNNLLEQLERILKTKLNAKGLEQLVRFLSLKPATNRADNEKIITESGRSLAEILQALSSVDDTGKLKEAQTGFIKPEITQEQFDNIALPNIKEQVALIKEGIKDDSSLANLIKQYTLIQEKIKWIRKHNKLFTIKGNQNSEIQGQAESLKYLQGQIKEIANSQGLDFNFDILDSLQSAKHQFDGGIEEFILLAKQSGIELGDNFLKAVDKVMGISSPSKKMKVTAKWIVQGLRVGIVSNLSAVKDTASLVPEAILETIDDGLGIRSPAKEIRDRALNIVQTLANTISSGINLVEPAVTKISDGIKNGFAGINEEVDFELLKEELSNIFTDFVSQTPLLENNIGKITGLFKQLWAVGIQLFVLNKITDIFKKLNDGAFDAALKVENLQRQLSFATRKNGVTELNRIRKEADAIGISFIQASEGLRQFSASTIGTSLNENAGEIVSQFQKSFATFGLNSEQQEGAFLALSQMASKGVVSMEELRQQLAERLPGAMGMSARAMGVTVPEFLKLVESGQVLSEDLLPALATQLENESALGLAMSAKSTQAELTRLESNIFNLQAGLGSIQLPIARLGLKALNGILQFLTKHATELVITLASFTVTTAIAFISAVKGMAVASVLLSKALSLVSLGLKLVWASMAPMLPYIILISVVTKAIVNLHSYLTAGSKEVKEYSKSLEDLSTAMDAIKKKDSKPEKFVPRLDNDFKNWGNDDYGWSGWGKSGKTFLQATREEMSEFWDFVTNRSAKVAKAFNTDIERIGKANQAAIDIYQSASGNNDIDLGNGVTVKDDYSDASLQAIQDRLAELRAVQQNLKLQIAVASDQGDAKFLESLNKNKAEVEKEIQRVQKESFMDSAVIAQGIQAQQAMIEQIQMAMNELNINKDSYSEKDFNSRMNTYKVLLQDSENALANLLKREEQQQKAIKANIDLYTKQIASLRILQQTLSNIEYTTGLQSIDSQIGVLSKKLSSLMPEYQFDTEMRQVRMVEIQTKFTLSAQAFKDYESDVMSHLSKISDKTKQSIAEFLEIDNLDSAILNKQISPETLAKLTSEQAPTALKEAIESESELKALVEKGQEYLRTWQQIKQQQLESVNLIKEQQDALKQRIEDLRGFARSLEDLDVAVRDYLKSARRGKEDIDLAVRDYEIQRVRGLEDFIRSVEDASIQYRRQQRDLLESYQDMNRQMILQTAQVRRSIDEATRDIQRRSILNELRSNLKLGGQGLFATFYDAIDTFFQTINDTQNEQGTLEEQRLQLQEDVIGIAKQIRGLQEQLYDMERQRILQVRDLLRQHVDYIKSQLDAHRNITRQLEDFADTNKDSLKAITRQFEDMESQARSMGLKFDNIFKAFNGINTNYSALNGAISGLIGTVKGLREQAKKDLENSRANPNVPNIPTGTTFVTPVVPKEETPVTKTETTRGNRLYGTDYSLALIMGGSTGKEGNYPAASYASGTINTDEQKKIADNILSQLRKAIIANEILVKGEIVDGKATGRITELLVPSHLVNALTGESFAENTKIVLKQNTELFNKFINGIRLQKWRNITPSTTNLQSFAPSIPDNPFQDFDPVKYLMASSGMDTKIPFMPIFAMGAKGLIKDLREAKDLAVEIAQIPVFEPIIGVPNVKPLAEQQKITQEELTETLQLQNTVTEQINIKKSQGLATELTNLKIQEFQLKTTQMELKAVDQYRLAINGLVNAMRSQADSLRQQQETWHNINKEVNQLVLNSKGYLLPTEQVSLALVDVSEKYRTLRKNITDFQREVEWAIDQAQGSGTEAVQKIIDSPMFKRLPEDLQQQALGILSQQGLTLDKAKAELEKWAKGLPNLLNEINNREPIELEIVGKLTRIDADINSVQNISKLIGDMVEGANIASPFMGADLQKEAKRAELLSKQLETQKLLTTEVRKQRDVLNDATATEQQKDLAREFIRVAEQHARIQRQITDATLKRSYLEIDKNTVVGLMQRESEVRKALGERQKEMNPFGGGSVNLAEAERLDIMIRYQEQLFKIREMEMSGQYSPKFIAEVKAQLDEITNYDLSKIEEKFSVFAQAIREPMQQAFTSLFSDVVRGTKSIGDVLNEFLTQVANFFANLAAQFVTNQVMGWFKQLGFFALGGLGGGLGSGIGGGALNAGGGAASFLGSATHTIASGLSIGNFNEGGEIERMANLAKNGEILNLGLAVNKALRKEGNGGIPVVAHIGEQILTTRNGDAQLFRQLQTNGEWDRIKYNFKYQGDAIPNFRDGGTVGNINTTNKRTPQVATQGAVYNYAINVTTKDADSFRKSKSLIAQEQKLMMERNNRFN